MPSVWSKLDLGLSTIYGRFLHSRAPQQTERVRPQPVVDAVHVVLHYSGGLRAIERAGFITTSDDGEGLATGSLRLDDLERIAACNEAIHIAYGQEHLPALDDSIPDIRANQIWSVTDGTFSTNSGQGVIVGVIDTGIDFRHEFFLKPGTPGKTRILRIWDQGLEPTEEGERSPDSALLFENPSFTYGVEYDEKQLNDVLGGVSDAIAVRHRDCAGHGTHVSSIAAGNGQARFKYIGVAPEADLVVVKQINLEKEPKVMGFTVSHLRRFMDAVAYILNIASGQAEGITARPVVINYSAGSNLGPHDGFSAWENFLTKTFDPATSAGKLFVNASGNSANRGQHARIEFPDGGGTVEIPFKLYDKRLRRRDRVHCELRDATKDLFIDCFYDTGGPTLTFAFQPHGEATFEEGPALNAAPITKYFAHRQYTMEHKVYANPRTDGSIASRNDLWVLVEPNAFRGRGHVVGTYTLRLTASAKMTAHLWCSQAVRHGFELSDSQPDGVLVEERYLIGEPGGSPNIVTVGGFDAEKTGLPLYEFSSNGPLVEYGGVPAPAEKPDLCAPGVGIDAARSQDEHSLWASSVVPKRGTSMAAPHVAGALALMLQKKPDLTLTEALTALRAGIRAASPKEEFGAGRLDAKGAFDNTP
jgi:subtilisin family serine protease